MMGSPTPSQLSTFGSKVDPVSLYGASFTMPQRSVNNQTLVGGLGVGGGGLSSSLGLSSGYSLSSLQQQQQLRSSNSSQQQPAVRAQQAVSPSRNMFNMGQHNLLTQLTQASLNNLSQLKSQQRANNTFGSAPLFSTTSAANNYSRTLGDVSQASLDLSDFPSLGSRSMQQSQLLSGRNYVGMVSKPQPDTAPEFQIQQEDFPALPGAQNPASSSSDGTSKQSTGGSMAGSYDQAVKDSSTSKTFNEKAVGQQRRGIQTHPDGTVSNIPAGMVTDQFGIVGLLTFIRAAETDPNLVALAPGIDLTTLGLNLNSPDNLYSTFQSPWADAPCRPQDIDYYVPTEYLTNIYIRDKLAPIKFNRYQEDLLFFLFYVNGGDVLQLAAAAELYNRDWRFHKEERIWITRAPGMEPLTKTNAYERGTYVFFDVHNWRKIPKEFHLEYSKLEDRPQLPDIHSLNKTGN